MSEERADLGRQSEDGAGTAPPARRTEYPLPHRGEKLLPALAVFVVLSFVLGGTWALEEMGDGGLLSEPVR